MAENQNHAACVDAWLERAGAKSLPRDATLALFETAVLVLWRRTNAALGDVTLGQIATRVLSSAADRYPALASITVTPDGRIHASGLRSNVEALNHLKLLEGMRFVIVEFLTVLGDVTGNQLTTDLHHELRGVRHGRPALKANHRGE